MLKLEKITLFILAALISVGFTLTANAARPMPVKVENVPDVNVANTPLDVTVMNGPTQPEPCQAQYSEASGYGSSDAYWASG